jgi:hypothetical protein
LYERQCVGSASGRNSRVQKVAVMRLSRDPATALLMVEANVAARRARQAQAERKRPRLDGLVRVDLDERLLRAIRNSTQGRRRRARGEPLLTHADGLPISIRPDGSVWTQREKDDAMTYYQMRDDPELAALIESKSRPTVRAPTSTRSATSCVTSRCPFVAPPPTAASRIGGSVTRSSLTSKQRRSTCAIRLV